MDHAVATASTARAGGGPREGAARPSPGAFLSVALALGVVVMGNNLPSPLYGIYQQRFGFSALTLTGIFAVAAASVLPVLLAFGSVSDRAGRRRVLLVALGFAAGSSLVFLAADSVAWLIAARLLAGVAIGLTAGTAGAALAEVEPGGNHARAALAAAVATVSGQALAPLLSGLLAQYLPAPTRTVFVVNEALLGAVAVLLWTTLRDTPAPISVRAWTPTVTLAVPPAARRAFTLASSAAFGAFAVMGVIASVGPTFLAQVLHVHNRAVGGLVVCLLLSCSAAAQLLARAADLPRLFLAGPILLITGLALIVAADPARQVLVFFFGTCIAGIGQGLSYIAGQRLLDRAVDAPHRAGVFSAFFVGLYVGTAAGALGVGLLTAPLGFFGAVTTVSCAVTAAAATTVLLAALPAYRRVTRPTPSE